MPKADVSSSRPIAQHFGPIHARVPTGSLGDPIVCFGVFHGWHWHFDYVHLMIPIIKRDLTSVYICMLMFFFLCLSILR